MSDEKCILTTKDFTILEVMRDRCPDPDDALARLLKRKLETAMVMFRDDVPENVATLNSRVTFSVNGRDPDTRIISHDQMNAPVGLFLPVTILRGLALLGLSEGQEISLINHEGAEERIRLEKVCYQPEAARREKQRMERLAGPASSRPKLTLIRGAAQDRPQPMPAGPDGFDDPGPSAA